MEVLLFSTFHGVVQLLDVFTDCALFTLAIFLFSNYVCMTGNACIVGTLSTLQLHGIAAFTVKLYKKLYNTGQIWKCETYQKRKTPMTWFKMFVTTFPWKLQDFSLDLCRMQRVSIESSKYHFLIEQTTLKRSLPSVKKIRIKSSDFQILHEARKRGNASW